MKDDEIMNRLQNVEQGLEEQKKALAEYKATNEIRNAEIESRLSAVHKETLELKMLVSGSSPPAVKEPDKALEGELLAEADNADQYGKNFLSNGLFANTNGYAFTRDNGNPEGSFIKIYRVGLSVVFKFMRIAEGKVTEHGRPTNEFVAAHPLISVGAQNGREVSNEPTAERLPGNLKRQYGYPAYDLEKVSKRVGLPSLVENLKELSISGRFVGSFYVFNAFLDMYLHDLFAPGGLSGYEGTLNAIDGNYTKSINLNIWFVKPSKVNTNGPANGWTGGIDIGVKKTFNGVVFKFYLKHETEGGNSFLYVAGVPEDDIYTLLPFFDLLPMVSWASTSMWDDINKSDKARALIESMPNPPKRPTKKLALCSLNLGPELWWTKDGPDTFTIEQFAYTINGVTRYIDGSLEGPEEGQLPPVEDEPVQDDLPNINDDSPIKTPPLVFNSWQAKSMDVAGWEIHGGKDKKVFRVRKNQPQMVIVPKRKGNTILTWKDAAGVVYQTAIVVM